MAQAHGTPGAAHTPHLCFALGRLCRRRLPGTKPTGGVQGAGGCLLATKRCHWQYHAVQSYMTRGGWGLRWEASQAATQRGVAPSLPPPLPSNLAPAPRPQWEAADRDKRHMRWRVCMGPDPYFSSSTHGLAPPTPPHPHPWRLTQSKARACRCPAAPRGPPGTPWCQLWVPPPACHPPPSLPSNSARHLPTTHTWSMTPLSRPSLIMSAATCSALSGATPSSVPSSWGSKEGRRGP